MPQRARLRAFLACILVAADFAHPRYEVHFCYALLELEGLKAVRVVAMRALHSKDAHDAGCSAFSYACPLVVLGGLIVKKEPPCRGELLIVVTKSKRDQRGGKSLLLALLFLPLVVNPSLPGCGE